MSRRLTIGIIEVMLTRETFVVESIPKRLSHTQYIYVIEGIFLLSHLHIAAPAFHPYLQSINGFPGGILQELIRFVPRHPHN